jgi:hypothetical protein
MLTGVGSLVRCNIVLLPHRNTTSLAPRPPIVSGKIATMEESKNNNIYTV